VEPTHTNRRQTTDTWGICEGLAYWPTTGILHPTLLSGPLDHINDEIIQAYVAEDELAHCLRWLQELESQGHMQLSAEAIEQVTSEKEAVREQRSRLYDEMQRLTGQKETSLGQLKNLNAKPAHLTIARLRLESPLDVNVAIEAVGQTGAIAYGVYLLVHALKDPRRIGAWLPRLIASWHEGQTERMEAKLTRLEQERTLDDAAAQLVRSQYGLVDMTPVEITAEGAGDPPDDLVHAFID
jgi:hypothetical protein